jgi:hypothetical protein
MEKALEQARRKSYKKKLNFCLVNLLTIFVLLQTMKRSFQEYIHNESTTTITSVTSASNTGVTSAKRACFKNLTIVIPPTPLVLPSSSPSQSQDVELDNEPPRISTGLQIDVERLHQLLGSFEMVQSVSANTGKRD